MKQIAQYQDGRLELQEVPAPVAPPGGVLVRVTHSVVSSGTERMKVEQARMNLLHKARARPDQVRKVVETARTLGWRAAMEKVRNRLETPTPLGYSAAGIVAAVDPGHTRLRVGDAVACGGAECAFHAEMVAVPDLLVAAVPAGVPLWQAAYTTLASVALHAVRQAAPQLGERVLVMGQGLIGLLITNLLRAAGCRVLAVDVSPARRAPSEAMGAERVVILGDQDLHHEALEWTEGYGVDAAVLCTAAADNRPTEQAADVLRDRGRIVIVGNTRADLDWKVFYEKELEVRYSRSYGPGRYDPAYEWGGSDYPIGYVRWTEQRNFDAVLQLMRAGQLHLDAITTRRAAFADALEVYRGLSAGQDIGVVLEFAAKAPAAAPAAVPAAVTPESLVSATPAAPPRRAQPAARLDVIGAGNFARTMLLPHLRDRVPLGTVVNQTALSASHVRSKFGFAQAATDARALIETDGAAAVLIATRHHLHASLVVAALKAGRDVFVEKPLCLTRVELADIDAAVAAARGSLMVGFNRRFAPASVVLARELARVTGPRLLSYRVAPGPLDPHHWYANVAESGGRVLGEACHFVDYACFLMASPPVRVTAEPLGPVHGRLAFVDGFSAQVAFADGSCAQLVYAPEASAGWPKEVFTVFASGFAVEVTNFQQMVLHRRRAQRVLRFGSKGHAEEMAAWIEYLQARAPHPLDYAAARQSMHVTFAVLESIQQGRPIEL